MYDAQSTAAPSSIEPLTAQPIRLEFFGKASEYFRIWIVNVLLSVLTLGIYSAWAKVRNKRYFYGNTVLDGANFEYHAKPMQILKGRMIVFAFFVIYSAVGNFFPVVGSILGLLILLLMPWVINLSLRFNARMSSYRNIHFDFEGSYGKAFMTFLVLPVVCILPFGLLLPYAHRAIAHYISRGMRFGGQKFHSDLKIGPFYSFFMELVMLGVLILVATTVGSLILQAAGIITDGSSLYYLLLPVLLWGFLLFFVPVYRAKVRNLTYNNLHLEGGHRFASTLYPWRMAWITLSNLLCIVATLGLMVPWARVRMTRYVAENTAVIPAGDLSDFVSTLEVKQQAFGSEMADVMGWDIGL